MIRQLMREQLRSHRTYVIWTTALLTLAVAMASYAAFSGAQGAAVSQHAAEAYGMDGDWIGFAQLYDNGYTDPGVAVTTAQELSATISAANQQGAGAAARMDFGLDLSTPLAQSDGSTIPTLWPTTSAEAVTGDLDWDALLASGSAPGDGEIAVSASQAALAQAQIGDTVSVSTWVWANPEDEDVEVDLGTLTISGLLRDPLPGDYHVDTPTGLVTFETASDLDARLYSAGVEVWDGALLSYATITAEEPTDALAAYWDPGVWMGSFIVLLPATPVVLAVGAGVLLVGLIGMAFTVGRAQAQARTGWIATARVLGATRGTIATATALEVLVIGFVAGLGGSALGYAAVAMNWIAQLAEAPDALAPPSMQAPLWLWAAMTGVGVVIAAIIGAIPAFWAARVAPAAALKPVTPATQAEISRKAPIWPVLALWALFTVPLLIGLHVTDSRQPLMHVLSLAAPLLGFGALVTSVPLMIELTRRSVARVSHRIALGSRPWAIAAGGALTGRLRQASGPASVIALAASVAFGITTWTALARWADDAPVMYWGTSHAPSPLDQMLVGTGYDDFGATLMGVIAIGMLTLVAVALGAFMSLRQATAAEADATAALGLDARGARMASGVQFASPMLTGLALGALVGIAGAVSMFSYQAWEPIAETADGAAYSDSYQVGPIWAVTHLSHAVVPLLLVLAISLICVGLGAAIVAATTRTSSRPLDRTRA
ncbi:FtsX-like permease family protein [Demequina sp. NBRC 110052]|uniref:FtsX-like permease family protein n=1 Tax=Demequina sp. NBRC 110052 TaxID=1570341 RepID=UPI0013563C92|nr:FtsX-like permease family protein [Demequina sp. NBRC 110052]